MADTYFNTGNPQHVERLREDIRDETELDATARRAERDVLTKLRNMRRVDREATGYGCGRTVDLSGGVPASGGYIVGYPRDPSHADAPTGEELEALLDVIADVISHRLRYKDEDPTLSLQSQGSRSKSRFKGALDPKWPDEWAAPVRPWRQASYGA